MKSFKVGIRIQMTIDNRRSPKSIYSKLSSAIIVNDDEKFRSGHQNPDDNRRSPKSIYSKLSSAIIVNVDEKFQSGYQNPDDN